MADYVPNPLDWVAKHVELYEGSNGTEGLEFRGFQCVLVTHTGRNTGAIRKTPLIRVPDGDNFVLIASMGGQPAHPVWYWNLLNDPDVTIRDGQDVRDVRVRLVEDDPERARLWDAAVAVYPEYADYQQRASGSSGRQIPVFLTEPR
jgi:deazaflavin-dependent oxidoreductase (nitroreductase family)